MKKIIIGVAIAISVIMALAIIALMVSVPGEIDYGPELSWATIRVEDQPWTGWAETNPAPLEKEFLVELGQVINLRELSVIGADQIENPYSYLKIVKIREKTISIEAINLFQSVNGGIDMTKQSDRETYDIKLGGSIELATPTMDAGNIYTVTYISGQ